MPAGEEVITVRERGDGEEKQPKLVKRRKKGRMSSTRAPELPRNVPARTPPPSVGESNWLMSPGNLGPDHRARFSPRPIESRFLSARAWGLILSGLISSPAERFCHEGKKRVGGHLIAAMPRVRFYRGMIAIHTHGIVEEDVAESWRIGGN